jgi:hypothetical protein
MCPQGIKMILSSYFKHPASVEAILWAGGFAQENTRQISQISQVAAAAIQI